VPTPIEDFAAGLARGVLTAWVEMGPKIVDATITAARHAMQQKLLDVDQAPTPLVNQLNQEIPNAQK
jgi:hypothetical protein